MVILFAAGAIIIGTAAGLVIGNILMKAYGYCVERKLVAVFSPCVVMEMGDQDVVKATLIYKPSFSSEFINMNGKITYTRNNNIYNLENGGSSITKKGDPYAHATILAANIGEGTLTVSGTSYSGDTYKPVTVPVEVVATQTDFVAYYGMAAKVGVRHWFDGWIGNTLINELKLGRKGLCDEWTDWGMEWVKLHNHCKVKRIEKIIYKGSRTDHVCFRITLSDGTVYYCDPHRDDKEPIKPKDEYEKDHGKPDESWEWWAKPTTPSSTSTATEDQ